MRALFGRSLGTVGLLMAAACTQSGVEDAGAEIQGRSGALALLQVERFVDADGTTMRMVAGAKVARYRNMAGDALLALLGAESVELESCVLSSGLANPSISAESEVELLSVGDITLRTADSDTVLEPRLFPALAATASGWFYAVDTEMTAPRVELDELFARAPGENAVGAFELTMAAPRDLIELDVAGQRLGAELLLPRTFDAELRWEADDPRDRIEIEVLAGGNLLSCAARDDGQFTIDRALLAALDADANGALVVRRVRGTAFDMQGVETSYARVASTRSATLTLR
jgi:hypothetical protein